MWTGDPYKTWGRHPEVHSTPETMGTRCDGCPHLTCIEQERSKLHPWRYYCEKLSRTFEFKDLFAVGKRDCPEHRDLRRRFSE